MEHQESQPKPENAELTEDVVGVDVPPLVVPLRRRTPSAIGLMALTAMLAGAAMYLPGCGGPSGQSIRNDPDREKTPDDLRKLEAARLKRERKAAKHSRHNAGVLAHADENLPNQ